MSSSFHRIYVHVFFHTKYSAPVIDPEWDHRLFSYMLTCAEQKNVKVIAVGGVRDHVHLLIRYAPNVLLSEVLRQVKSRSSRWVRETIGVKVFRWQEGFHAIAVGPMSVPKVRRYVLDQKERHRNRSYKEERVAMLKRIMEKEGKG